MALRRHIALASIHVATDFPGEHCNPAFSWGAVYDCPISDGFFENPDTTIVKINIETGSMEIIFEKT